MYLFSNANGDVAIYQKAEIVHKLLYTCIKASEEEKAGMLLQIRNMNNEDEIVFNLPDCKGLLFQIKKINYYLLKESDPLIVLPK